ncbi:MAG TPA: sigma-70 family RNA polymerase sigma factor [Polyangia bacterium]|nr:sigma-70 family RNA polymerase sigma factor [Polyangia bacterium]
MDDDAVADAFKTYGAAVFGRCARILRDAEAARDVTQEVFVRCFDRRARLRNGRELLGWLYRVATNLCLNALRDGKARREADRLLAPATVTEAPETRSLWELLRDLDERTQAIVVYVHLDGMTHAEAAEVAQVSDRTVRNCLARFQRLGRMRLGADLVPSPQEGSR